MSIGDLIMERCTQADVGPALAAHVATDLRLAISEGRRASLAVPGGTTPAPFLTALAEQALDWSQVTVTLTDERCVPFDDPRSNHRLVHRHLLRGRAAQARFVPLHAPGRTIAEIEQSLIQAVLPLHVCVLGMGDDMHAASLFPDTPGLASLLHLTTGSHVSHVTPPGAAEARVTLTAKALASSAHTYLLIRGPSKRDALARAMRTADPLAAPIRVILDAARTPRVFYAD